MLRRQFIKTSVYLAGLTGMGPSILTLGCTSPTSNGTVANKDSSFSSGDNILKAGDLRDYFKSLDGGWVDWENTVDDFKSGSPEVKIEGIAISWISTLDALKQALELNCNVFVTHEPTFYNHFDYTKIPEGKRAWGLEGVSKNQESRVLNAIQRKLKFIQDNKITILRNHDLWDKMPEIGIASGWASLLGLKNLVLTGGEGLHKIFDVSGRTAGEIAQQVAKKASVLGQMSVPFIGDPEMPVTRLAIGTGMASNFKYFLDEYGVDIAICCDDGFLHWSDGALAQDMEIPIILANHAVTEIPGMNMLAEHLKDRFRGTPVHFIKQNCMYQFISA